LKYSIFTFFIFIEIDSFGSFSEQKTLITSSVNRHCGLYIEITKSVISFLLFICNFCVPGFKSKYSLHLYEVMPLSAAALKVQEESIY